MDVERRREEDSLQTLFTQGEALADSLEFISNLDYIRFEGSESPGSKIYYLERSKILRITAERIQNGLSFLKQRLSEIGPRPGT